MASITFKHVKKIYPGNVTVVPDLNLETQDKEFVILVGPSGCVLKPAPRRDIVIYPRYGQPARLVHEKEEEGLCFSDCG